MGCKLTSAGEGPECDDETAAAAAGTSGDCGGGAPRRSASPTLSPSPPPAPTSLSPSPPPAPTPSSSSTSSPPQSPRPTLSSPSSDDEPAPVLDLDLGCGDETSSDCGGGTPWRWASPTYSSSSTSSPPLSSSPTQSPRSTPSSPSSADEEIEWAEEQEFAELEESFGSTHLHNTCSDSVIQDPENDDPRGLSNSSSTLGHKVQLRCFSLPTPLDADELVVTLDNYNDDIINEKIRLLSKKYGFFRRIPGDGSCFYRAFIFNYLENVVELKDDDERKAEAARLRQRVEKFILACYDYDEDLLPAFFGFEFVVNVIEKGLAAGQLYDMEMTEHVTSRILPLLRSLTEIEICTREEFYHAFLEEIYGSVFELCLCEVRPVNGEANDAQITALVNALGIPLILENLDGSLPVRLNPHHIYPRQESEAEALELNQSVDGDDSSTSMGHVEQAGSRNLSPAKRRRLVTLLYRPGHYDIIYPK